MSYMTMNSPKDIFSKIMLQHIPLVKQLLTYLKNSLTLERERWNFLQGVQILQ
jgi:hypothetical protein